jgi:hypothetical protein
MSAASPQQGAALSADVAAGLLHLVDRLQRENLELAGRLGFLQAELQQRDETIRALQAPREEPENAVSVTVVSADQVDAPPPRRPSWWRRVLLGE